MITRIKNKKVMRDIAHLTVSLNKNIVEHLSVANLILLLLYHIRLINKYLSDI